MTYRVSLSPVLSGLAANRPTATGSGRAYITDDASGMYIDDPATQAWKQYSPVIYSPAPGLTSGWTIIGNLGLTQMGDSIFGTSNTAGNSCMLKAFPGGIVSGTNPYIVDMMGFLIQQTRTAYPELAVCLTNGITSGTSTVFWMGRYASTNGWGALHDTIGTGQGGKVSISNQDGNYDLIHPNFGMHVRLVSDNSVLYYQIGGDGNTWRLWASEALPANIGYYGAFIGDDTSSGLPGALVKKLRIRAAPTISVSTMSYSSPNAVITTSTPHGLATGMSISLRGVVTSVGTNPSGFYDSTVAVTGTNTFTVPASSFTYTSGGTIINLSL